LLAITECARICKYKMEITYLGHSSFKLRGKQKTVVTDPYGEKVGKFPRDIEADLVTVSHDHFDHNAVEKLKNKPFVINGPGEYEVGDVSVIGVSVFHDEKGGEERGRNTIFVIELDGLRVAHLGDLGHKLNDGQLEDMGAIDVVLIPVGGKYTIDAKTAKEVVGQIDPWVVIPMHYGETGGGGVEGLAPVADFLKEMGKSETVSIPKLVISTEKLPDDLQIVVLEKK
jgi:L-ascorbate metabolism protein UlaG (beta-lactamase superfamily)